AIDGKLFLPPADHRKADGKFPLVMVVPGSLGVAASHLAHAEAVSDDGFAAFVLDGFVAPRAPRADPSAPSVSRCGGRRRRGLSERPRGLSLERPPVPRSIRR